MDKVRLKAFAQRVFADMGASMAAGLAYLGTETGLFRAMAGTGPMRADQVAAAARLEPRYVEEWLKGMVAAQYLDYDAATETYRLPDEHAYFLASEGSDHFMGGLFYAVPGMLETAPRVARAFRDGGGVPFSDYGPVARQALDLMNSGIYEHRFAAQWIKAAPEAEAALHAGGAALDVGCGVGRVSIALARAFPNARCEGVDLDAESIVAARWHAEAAGLAARVTFHAGRIENLAQGSRYDLITAVDCVHDLADPVGTLQAVRERLTFGGTLFLVELKVADRVEENVNPIAAMFYGFSVFHCLTQSLSAGGAGLGGCLGPRRTEALMRQAGFGTFRRLEIPSPVNLFYAVGH